MRELVNQLAHQLIQAENVAVRNFHLTIRAMERRANLRHIAVHIPFNIGYRNRTENLTERFKNIFPNISPRIIQDQLVTSFSTPAPRYMQTPVRMTAI
ncbi:hypothetical protein D3C86_1691020 [compost metagenome]